MVIVLDPPVRTCSPKAFVRLEAALKYQYQYNKHNRLGFLDSYPHYNNVKKRADPP